MRIAGVAGAAIFAMLFGAAGSSVKSLHFGSPNLVASVDVPGVELQEIAAADVTGDGHTDVVLTQIDFQDPRPVPVTILVGDGHGHFADKTAEVFEGPIPAPVYPRRTLFGDFNGDGRPDIFIADTGRDLPPFPGHPNTLILSAPGGKLVDASANLPRTPGFTHCAGIGDVNGDGNLDIYAGNLPNSVAVTPPEILLNDGSGHFHVLEDALPSDLVTAGAPHYDGCALADVNGDGAPDLVLAGAPGVPNRLLLNDGTGHFHDLRDAFPVKPWGTDNSNGIAVTPIDVNGDGHVDLLIGYTKDKPYYVGRWIQVLINNGDGTFRDETAMRLPQTDNSGEWPYTIQVADLNGDGKPDIGVSIWWVPPDVPPIYLNDGKGVFTLLPRDALVEKPAPTFTFLDANGDGRSDIYFAESGHPQLHKVMLQTAPKARKQTRPRACKKRPRHRCR